MKKLISASLVAFLMVAVLAVVVSAKPVASYRGSVNDLIVDLGEDSVIGTPTRNAGNSLKATDVANAGSSQLADTIKATDVAHAGSGQLADTIKTPSRVKQVVNRIKG